MKEWWLYPLMIGALTVEAAGEIEYRKGNHDEAFASLRKSVTLDEKMNEIGADESGSSCYQNIHFLV